MTGGKLFDKRYPSEWTAVLHPDRFRTYSHVATDGRVVYLATTSSSCWGAPCAGQLVAMDLELPTQYCEHVFAEGGVALCEQCNCNASGCPAATDPTNVARSMRQRPNGGGNNGWDSCNGFGGFWSSAIQFPAANDTAAGTNVSAAASGLAVQGRGPLLFVSFQTRNEIRVYDKTSGELLSVATVDQPRQLATMSNVDMSRPPGEKDGQLFAVLGKGSDMVGLFTVNMSSGAMRLTANTTNLSAPVLNLALSPDGERLVVAEGGSAQLVVRSSDRLQELHRIGEAGGYLANPADVDVRPTRWHWIDSHNVPGMALAFDGDTASDGQNVFGDTVWLTDPGNHRILHLNLTTGALLGDPVMFIPSSYVATAVESNPKRVFSNFLEFEVQYEDNLPLNRSWKLVRNWGAALPAGMKARDSSVWDGFHAVVEVAGTTLGYLTGLDNPNVTDPHRDGQAATVVEMTAGKPVSAVAWFNNSQGNPFPGDIYPFPTAMLSGDGSIRYLNGSGAAGNTDNMTQQSVWSAAYDPSAKTFDFPGTMLATWSTRSSELGARYGSPGVRFPITDDGQLVLFDANAYGLRDNQHGHPNRAFHLGAIKRGGTKLSWQASPWGKWELIDGPPELWGDLSRLVGTGREMYRGFNVSQSVIDPATKDGRFGGNDTAINYAASFPCVAGNDIIYGFHGEFWSNGEANQQAHFRDNGLFIGQFGMPNKPGTPKILNQKGLGGQGTYRLDWKPAGHAGNSFSPVFVKAGNASFYIHNDENSHGGVHRWRVDGLDAVQVMTLELDPALAMHAAAAGLKARTKKQAAAARRAEAISRVTEAANAAEAEACRLADETLREELAAFFST